MTRCETRCDDCGGAAISQFVQGEWIFTPCKCGHLEGGHPDHARRYEMSMRWELDELVLPSSVSTIKGSPDLGKQVSPEVVADVRLGAKDRDQEGHGLLVGELAETVGCGIGGHQATLRLAHWVRCDDPGCDEWHLSANYEDYES